MHPNEQLIETFYTCFQKRDAAGMAGCYHPDIVFSDPVFPHLEGTQVATMWEMLCAGGKDLEIVLSKVRAHDKQGSAHWDATYSFSKTGRKVLNKIDASFEFRDGKIVRHTDSFDLWRWTQMALGPVGLLLGWSPPFQASVRKQAATTLQEFMQQRGGGGGRSQIG